MTLAAEVSRHSSYNLTTTTRSSYNMDTSADNSRTRSKNKNQHPGAVEVAAKRKRRTKAQIAEDAATQEAKSKERGRKAHDQIKNIANFEEEMAKKDTDADSAHPRSRKGDVHFFSLPPDLIVCY